MSHTDEARRPSDQRDRRVAIEIEVEGRWDALVLSELLIPFHSFLVQHDHERWVVHARAPGCCGESLSDALETLDDWRAEQQPRTRSCRVGGRPYRLGETRAASNKPRQWPTARAGRPQRKEQVMAGLDCERTAGR